MSECQSLQRGLWQEVPLPSSTRRQPGRSHLAETIRRLLYPSDSEAGLDGLRLSAHPEPEAKSRTERLRAILCECCSHQSGRIDLQNPPADLDRYRRFLEFLYRFFHDMDPLYRHDEVALLLPDVERRRRRLAFIAKDMADIGAPVPFLLPGEDYLIDLASALGWLYLAEAFHFAATSLLIQAAGPAFSNGFVARHLLTASGDRTSQWRIFSSLLDKPDLDAEAEKRTKEGVRQAHAHLCGLQSGASTRIPSTPIRHNVLSRKLAFSGVARQIISERSGFPAEKLLKTGHDEIEKHAHALRHAGTA